MIAILVAVGAIKQQADWVVYDTQKMAAGIQVSARPDTRSPGREE